MGSDSNDPHAESESSVEPECCICDDMPYGENNPCAVCGKGSEKHGEPADYDGVLSGPDLWRDAAKVSESGGSPYDYEVRLPQGWGRVGEWTGLFVADKQGKTIRRKSKICSLTDANGVVHTWPAPMRGAPPHETDYWVPSISSPSLVSLKRWQKKAPADYDIEMGIAHYRKKAAQAHGKALVAASKGAINHD